MSSTFIKAVAEKLKGKIVEVYQGIDHRQHIGYSDQNHNVKSVIMGRLVEVEEGCLTLEVRRGKDIGYVYINSWSIDTITEPGSGISIEDAYRPSTDIAGNRKRSKPKELTGKS